VADDPEARDAYKLVRQASALLLIAVIGATVVLDAIRGNAPSPLIVVPLLLTAAGLMAVDLPSLRPPK
jgi:hypothetical protein